MIRHKINLFLCSAVRLNRICYFSAAGVPPAFWYCYAKCKNIRCWCKKCEEAGCSSKRKSVGAAKHFREGIFKSSRDFLAKHTKVHLPCQPRTWHPSTNCKACVKTTLSHAIVKVAHDANPSCWRQNKA